MSAADTLLCWVTDGLAGLPLPGLGGSVTSDISLLKAAGVGLLITLTEEPAAFAAELEQAGIVGRHFPIRAYGIPDLDDTLLLCEEVAALMAQGTKVAFHCWAGLGRTGVLLASQLVVGGSPPTAAIAHVRAVIPGAIETREQAEFVYDLAARLAGARVTMI